ncbi:dipeptidyl aminopeptidase/acylaminoacyl peptidase [Halogeometricum borinquense DSM 11551]|uniref:Acyl-peptide hydrolase n=1 Tax=Halogeometricum borinquense (strain ATCC 700274 / DSM 11551 / JCM 10706 / KCTC 4070 / PR3) TaxID=469382 RepID=E4NRA7_HALBP|nr:S9 family peptidase [Halogeometricum borinquense]ADQ67948.1 dipeptidyl aminopeptidase/acylaminoacyl peptidase [Halogeometricum borinquense DSM 11551]ELY24132.1 dipeptidyl aminopeptidase/acylaminoacyl peptidase [Halogeometricum borinquense DSM 11551]
MTTHDIERYLNIRSAYGASFGPDGERLSFLMDTTGVPQVWTLDGPAAWPEQRTFYDERVTFASWSPENPELVFGMDEGGNERQQLLRYDPISGGISNLTEMPDAKHRWGGWSNDGDRFAFTSNRRDEAVFDVYVQGRDETGDAAEMVHEGDGWLTVGGWSPDDSMLVVSEAYSNFDQDVSVLDVETGELTHLTPHEGTVRFQSAEWGPDGENVYLVSDRDSDTLDLWRVNVESGEFSLVAEDDEWEIDGVAVDHDSRRIVYSTNVDGYTELTVGELTAPDRIDEYAVPDLPRGVAGGVSFSPDGDRFAVTVSRSSDTANVYVVDAKTGEVTQWTHAATAGIPRDTFVEPELVHYPTFDGREIPAFFSLPDDDAGEGDTPVIVDIHGGPESQRRPSFNAVKQYFLANGYAVFEPNVRGSAGYGKAYGHLDDVENRMDSVADIEAAVEWLHDHPAVDPDRIVAMGGSYGGFMVLASMTEYPDLWAAGIDTVGIANFVTFLENTGDWRRELREAEYGSLEDDREFLESISPINNIEKIRAPLFVLHGENDPRVPVSEAHQIVEKAGEHVPVRELIFEDEGHGFTKLENRIEAYEAIVEFLDEHV